MATATTESSPAPSKVRLLPPDLCNQIAAGEVLERPSSAVKEMVENSLDAGATSVFVDLEAGGRDLIRITDDGSGMRREDAELSLQRHATSKIATLADLDAINTLGFRGEALASIASVSRLKLVTQLHDAMVGTEIQIDGGRLNHVQDTAAAPGTRIEVRELFFNTPARLKFLKRPATELRRVQAEMQRMAIAAWNVHFRLTSDGRKRFDLPPHSSLGDRLLAVLGRDTCDGLYPLPELRDVDGVTTRGYFGEPSLNQRGTGSQYTFVNGRFIKDRTIGAAINAAYRELIPKGRRPIVVLLLQVPPQSVDVNVHPTKIEVRFQNTDAVFRSVFRGLRDGLAAAPWASEIPETLSHGAPRPRRPLDAHSPTPDESDGFSQRDLDQVYKTSAPPDAPDWVRALLGGDSGNNWQAGETPTAGEPPPDAFFSRLRYIGQYARAYLLCSDNRGLVVIDQHAAHERISFERLRASWKGRPHQAQQLLFPVQIELDALRAAVLEEHLDFFTGLGFDLVTFGENAFALRAVPGILAGAKYQQVLRDAVDDLANVDRTERVEEAIEAVLSRMACHGSVRAGDDLTPDEAYALFSQMDEIDFRGNCPHGRPVFFRMSLEELEKRFDRR